MPRATKAKNWEQAEFTLGLKRVPLGVASWRAVFSDAGLAHLTLLTENDGAPSESTLPLSTQTSKHLKELKKRLAARLHGKNVDYAWDEMDVSRSGPFHQSIWRAMHAIPFGETRTYGEMAIEAGSPLAFRACGQACGANPIVLFIPCHRVVSSTGIGGFGSGLDLKRTFLKLEKNEQFGTKK